MKNARRYLALLLSLLLLFGCFDSVAEGTAEAEGGLAIITEPQDQTLPVGSTVVLTVEAAGAAAYRWQISPDCEQWVDCPNIWEGYNTDTLRFVPSAAQFKLFYRCAVIGTGGMVYTRTVKLTIGELAEKVETETPVSSSTAVINIQPVGTTASAGETVTLTINASNVAAYRWQYYTDGKWTNMTSSWTGYNGAVLTMTMDEEKFAYSYRCRVTGPDGKHVYSNAVTIEKAAETPEPVQPDPVITKQPVNATAAVGETVTFKLAATDAASYRWQVRKPGASWANLGSAWTGYNKAVLSVPVDEEVFAWQFRCRVTGTNGKKIYSNVVVVEEAVLTLSITSEPEDVTAAVGDTITLSVRAENAESYQWQYLTSTGVWKNAISTWGTTTSSDFVMTLTASRFNYQYRCKVSGAGSVAYTRSVTLSKASAGPVITQNPGDTAVASGEEATLSVIAENAESYQWQYLNAAGEWKNVPSTWGTATSSALVIKMSPTKFTFEYRCAVTGGGVTVYSESARIERLMPVSIYAQSLNDNVLMGGYSRLSVEAENATGYQWQYLTAAGEWKNVPSSWVAKETPWGDTTPSWGTVTSDTLVMKMTITKFNFKYRCRVDGVGGPIYSDPITITRIYPEPVIVTQPEDCTANVGDVVTLSVTAQNATAYRWQYSKDGGTTWTNVSTAWTGYNTAALSITMSAGRFNYIYRVKVTGEGGTVYSDSVTITKAHVAVTGVSLDIPSKEMKIGDTLTLAATVSPSDATDKSVTWASSDESVAAVSSKGVVTAIATGTAVITVTTVDGGKTATCEITVIRDLPTLIRGRNTLSPDEEGYIWGSFTAPENAEYDFFSRSGALADVILFDVSTGSPLSDVSYNEYEGDFDAFYTMTAGQTVGFRARCTDENTTGVKIYIDIQPDAPVLNTPVVSGNTITLSWNAVDYAVDYTVLWRTSGQEVFSGATTDGLSYTLTDLEYDTEYIITVVSSTGLYCNASREPVSVTTGQADGSAVSGVSLNISSKVLKPGETLALIATVSPSTATNKSVTWSSSNKNVATVSSKGVVTAMAAGTAVITVTTVDGGKTATCEIAVTSNLTAISRGRNTLMPGNDGYAWASFTAPCDGEFNFFSANISADAILFDVSTYRELSGVRYADYDDDFDIYYTMTEGQTIGIRANYTDETTGRIVIYADVVPDAPVVSSVVVSGNTITLNWDAAANAEEYLVFWKTAPDGEREEAGTVELSYTITDLEYDTEYVVLIGAGSGLYEYTYSDWLTVTTGSAPTLPTIFDILSMGDNSLTTDDDGYVWGVFTAPYDGSFNFFTLCEVATKAFMFDVTTGEAQSDVVYDEYENNFDVYCNMTEGQSIGIRANYYDGSTGEMTVYVDILPDMPVMETPVVSGNTITVSWSEVTGAEYYELYWKAEEDTVNSRIRVDGLSYTLSDLEYDTTYEIWLCANSGRYWASQDTEPVSVTTDPGSDGSVTGVSLNLTQKTLSVGKTFTLTATLTPSRPANRNVTWSSSNTRVATVSTSGVVTAKAEGTATITVTTEDGGLTATCTVTVTEAASGPTYRALLIGEANYIDSGSDLPGCKQDVAHMSALLNSVNDGAYAGNIVTKLNLEYADVQKTIKDAADGATEDDVFFFMWTGHGVTEGELSGSLVTADFYAFAPDEIAACLGAIPGKVIVVIDACGSGDLIYNGGVCTGNGNPSAFTSALISAFSAADSEITVMTENSGELRQSKFIVMTAVTKAESSWCNDDGSFFIDWFIEAAGGTTSSLTADSNRDGSLTAAECYNYVADTAANTPIYGGDEVLYQHPLFYAANRNYVLFTK